MNYLNIDNCIIIHDVKQIKKEPSGKKIKTKRQLSKLMAKNKALGGATELAIYTKMWRFEKEGFAKEPVALVDSILQFLEVSRSELVKFS